MLPKNRLNVQATHMTILILFTCLILMPLWARHQETAAKSQLHGRYSAQQITQLTETACLNLITEPTRLFFTAAPFAIIARDGTEVWIWEVEFRDASGNFIGIFHWNADTGALEEVSQQLPTPPLSEHIPSQQAVNAALYWLETLQMSPEKTWQLESAPQYCNGCWRCQFLFSKAKIRVVVRATDGQLLFAHRTE
ncbi:MAG TPA: hypothetical protein VKU00_25245 [Chthonomonadaceae bacterium]|nr:hypothetical protein [Chthonomonadaceae bacterium]